MMVVVLAGVPVVGLARRMATRVLALFRVTLAAGVTLATLMPLALLAVLLAVLTMLLALLAVLMALLLLVTVLVVTLLLLVLTVLLVLLAVLLVATRVR